MSEGNGAASAARGGPGRWLKLGLIASLAVNLLVIGGIAGSMLAWQRHGPRGAGRGGEEFGLLGFSRTLPAERAAVIRKAIQAERTALRPLRDEIRDARREAADVLVAEPFDRDKFKAAIDKISEAEAKLKSAGLSVFLNTAERLTADERRALHDWWQRRKPHYFRSRWDKRKGEPQAEPKSEGSEAQP